MSNHRTRWHERRQRLLARRPWIRLDDVAIEPEPKGDGYLVTIKGVNLRPAIVPPLVMLGGQRLTDLTFSPDGRQITGHLEERPPSRQVVVDLGAARARWPADDENK